MRIAFGTFKIITDKSAQKPRICFETRNNFWPESSVLLHVWERKLLLLLSLLLLSITALKSFDWEKPNQKPLANWHFFAAAYPTTNEVLMMEFTHSWTTIKFPHVRKIFKFDNTTKLAFRSFIDKLFLLYRNIHSNTSFNGFCQNFMIWQAK